MSTNSEFLTVQEASDLLRVTPMTLRNWRRVGIGPAVHKLNNSANGPVRYRRADIETWLRSTVEGA